jgi:hypothetical protein
LSFDLDGVLAALLKPASSPTTMERAGEDNMVIW